MSVFIYHFKLDAVKMVITEEWLSIQGPILSELQKQKRKNVLFFLIFDYWFVNKVDQECIDKIMLGVMQIYFLEIFDQFHSSEPDYLVPCKLKMMVHV